MASSPYVAERPDAACVSLLFAAVTSLAGTPHAAAAAWTSIQRAAAPVRRIPSTPVARTDRLPPVICRFMNSAILRNAKSLGPASSAGIDVSPRR